MKKWIWVGFPLGTIAFVLYSLMFLFGGEGRAAKFMEDQKKVKDEQVKIAVLKDKMAVLESIDAKKTEEDLTAMLSAVPASKEIWTLIRQLKQAGAVLGMNVLSFEGMAGVIGEASESAQADPNVVKVTVEYSSGDFSQVAGILGILEKYKPLVKIVKVDYDKSKAELVVNGAYANWVKIAADHDSPLPPISQETETVKGQLADLEELPTEVIESTESGVAVNPF